MTARLLDISPDEYHARPGFSASIAKTLIAKSALHAWQEHPEYGARGKTPTKAMDRGSAIHTFLLGKGKRIACLPYDDWTTKASRESRDKARAAGLVPLTHLQYTEYETAAKEIRERLESMGHFIGESVGRSEFAIEWTEDSSYGPVLCRCMMDHAIIERGMIFELKITDNAHPDHVQRIAENMGYDIGAAAYVRALMALRPELAGHILFRFLFCEPTPPYAVYAPEPDIEFLQTGESKWIQAVERWGRCLATDEWPHYEREQHLSRPQWAIRREQYA